MEGSNWRPNHDAAGDWRRQLQPEARTRIVNKIMETLMRHLPVSVPEGVSELQNSAMRVEEEIYTAATSSSDYLRTISLKSISMETRTQQTPANVSVLANQNSMDSGVGMQLQGSNQAQSLAIPLMNQPQARHLQNSTSTSVPASSLARLSQGLAGVSLTSSLQNMSSMPQNAMHNSLAQGASQDIYAAQRQMQGMQQHNSNNNHRTN